MEPDFRSIVPHFHISGELSDIAALATGHINDTYILTTAGRDVARYVLQRINHAVFKDPPLMMANIIRVTEHLRARMQSANPIMADRQLTLTDTDDGTGYYTDALGNFWRMYSYVEKAVTYDIVPSTELAYEAGRMFGWFQRMLIDLPAPSLHETIRGFHDTPRRLEVFREALRADPFDRVSEAKAEIDFVLDNVAICDVLTNLVDQGQIPIRIAHNDAKINNVMFDETTNGGVCVIDLDTVMPGLSIHDFGDMVRTAACTAAEDERDLSKVSLDIAMFEPLARGFVGEVSHFLTPVERQHLVFAGKLITFEQFIRFLTDHLAGDVYYKVRRYGHNLDRSRTQMKLFQSIVEQEETMNEIVERAFADTPG